MERRHEHGVLGRDAGGYCLAHHAVDVPRVGDVLGVAIVRAERDAPRPVLLDERQERLQVPRHRRLADEQPHPCADALAAFLDRQRLVIRVDARGRVRLQVAPHEPGRVAVHVLRTLDRELRELSLRAGDDAREVHHLAETEDPSPPHQRLEIARRERAARRLEGRGGHARRRHEVDVELETRRRVEEPVHAVDAEDVRDLVRVGDDSRGAQREHKARELVDHELHRLEVHVRVDESGDDVAARRVEDVPSLVLPEPRDTPSTTATSTSSHSRVKTESTRPPRTTRSAGSSPRATARRRCSLSIGGA